jgi:hypothetical protein
LAVSNGKQALNRGHGSASSPVPKDIGLFCRLYKPINFKSNV